jgi:hypothetical protein
MGNGTALELIEGPLDGLAQMIGDFINSIDP